MELHGFQALIFDFDGLILETESPIFQSWQELYHAYGQEVPKSDWDKSIGTVDFAWDPLDALEKIIARRLESEAIARRQQREAELIARLPVMPGVSELLESARRAGLRVGLASSSDRRWVTGHLTRLGLLDRFDCIRTSDDVRRTKPDPELYHAALACLEVPANRAIALEDSPNGVLAARRAGLFVVAVPNPQTRTLPLDQAHWKIDSLAGLTLEGLLARAAGSGNGFGR